MLYYSLIAQSGPNDCFENYDNSKHRFCQHSICLLTFKFLSTKKTINDIEDNREIERSRCFSTINFLAASAESHRAALHLLGIWVPCPVPFSHSESFPINSFCRLRTGREDEGNMDHLIPFCRPFIAVWQSACVLFSFPILIAQRWFLLAVGSPHRLSASTRIAALMEGSVGEVMESADSSAEQNVPVW